MTQGATERADGLLIGEDREIRRQLAANPDCPYTLKKIAAELVRNGIDVFEDTEGSCEECGCPQLSTISFSGDDNEGFRAAKIVCEYGIRGFQLNRGWSYLAREGDTPAPPMWQILIHRFIPRGD